MKEKWAMDMDSGESMANGARLVHQTRPFVGFKRKLRALREEETIRH